MRPICIAFNGVMEDFKDVYKVILYMFREDKILRSKSELVNIYKRNGLFGGNKRIYIIPNKKQLEKITEESRREEYKEEVQPI